MNADFRPPQVSVVVCVHNRPRQILACMDSLAAACHDDHEVVVVDDASTDDTADQVRAFGERHPQLALRLVSLAVNSGVSAARNAGAEQARGTVVLFTDSDCIVDADWVERLAAPLLAAEASAACGRVQDPSPRNLSELSFYGNLSLAPRPWQRRQLAGCNMGFRREVLEQYPFDEQLIYGCDEDDVARRMARDGHRFVYVDEAVVMHCHPMTFRAYLRQAWRQGKGSAWYWLKHRIYLGRDVVWGVLALLSLPLVVWDVRLTWLTALLGLLQIGCVWFNERVLKRLPLALSFAVMPVALAYNVVKTASVLFHLAGIIRTRLPPVKPAHSAEAIVSRV